MLRLELARLTQKQELQALAAVQRIQQLSQTFKQGTGRYPASLQELATAMPVEIALGQQ